MELTAAEKTFFLRMGHHIESGMDLKAAGEAVLTDDARLVDMALATDGADALHDHTFTRAINSSRARRGELIRGGLAKAVYRRLQIAQS